MTTWKAGVEETLRDGYDRRKTIKRVAEFRPMVVYEAKRLKYGDRVPFLDAEGTVREVETSDWREEPI